MIDSNYPTLSGVLKILHDLSFATRAEFVHTIQIQDACVLLVVFWDNPGLGRGSLVDMPRECHLAFTLDKEPTFLTSFVYCPVRYLWCLEEGLTDEEATTESCQCVKDLEQVIRYLLAEPYSVS